MIRLSARLGGVAALALAALVALPAGATQQSTVTIAPGQTYTHRYPPLPAPNPNEPTVTGEGQVDPAHCRSTTGAPACDDIPITLNVDVATLDSHSYTINAQVNWTTTTVNNGVTGNEQADQLDLYFWEDPPAAVDPGGAPSFDSSSEGAAPPATVTIIDPKSVHLDLVVAHPHGVNQGYTLTLTFVDYTGVSGPTDRSVDTVPDYSNTGTTITPGAPPATTGPVPTATPTTPGPTAAGSQALPLGAVLAGPDPQLVGLAPVNDNAQLATGPARNISRLGSNRLGPAGPVSGWAVTGALLVLPVLLAAGAFFAWRRRTSATSL